MNILEDNQQVAKQALELTTIIIKIYLEMFTFIPMIQSTLVCQTQLLKSKLKSIK